MIKKTLSIFLPANRYHRHKYTKYSDLTNDLLQAEKHDEFLTKNHKMCIVGASLMPEVHFNVQNNNKKFGGKKFKKNCKEKWNNNRQNYKASKGHKKGKITQKDNSQVCKRCGCHNHNTRRCHIPRHLVELYQKYFGKKLQEEKFETHFTTRPTDANCSKNVPTEHNEDVPTEHDNEKIPPQLDNLLSTDNMLTEFESNDIIGDMN
jgi:hypothetical protein